MAKSIENIKAEIEERMKELANIQPQKDALKYLEVCADVHTAYYMAKGVELRHLKTLGEDGIMSVFKMALEKAENALKEDF